jgi:voltage-gated potassium channel
MEQQSPSPEQPDLQQERWSLLEQIDAALDKPMIALAFVWLGLLILDFTQGGLSPFLQTVSNIIWGLFIFDFALGFTIAPRKLDYLRRNWLTAISLMLPALRLLRIFRALRLVRAARAARAARSVGLLRLVTSLNRGMRAIGNALGRRGIGYVVAITVIVTFGGAAGMYLFESPAALAEAQIDAAGLPTYGEAVWWTAMIMTTLGSEYWPQTAEGRILGWSLSVYALAIFGYITATIASFFVGQDTAKDQQPIPPRPNDAETAALRAEVTALREQIGLLVKQLDATSDVHTATNYSPQAPQREQPM